jgi:hypothetical protein
VLEQPLLKLAVECLRNALEEYPGTVREGNAARLLKH